MSQIAVMTPDDIRNLALTAIQPFLASSGVQSHGKKLLTGKEVEQEYGIAERNLERWRAEGIGPQYTNIGRRIFYERTVLEDFIVASRVRTTGKAD